jgi:hypothetical protein
MKSRFGVSLLFVALILSHPSRAFATDSVDGGMAGGTPVDAGRPSDGGDVAADDASSDGSAEGGTSNQVPLACDGGLCDTTTGGTPCGVAGALGAKNAPASVSLTLLLAVAGLRPLRRRARRAQERTR